MFAKTIIDSDAFLDMPLSAQALYFHLSMRADDEGFVGNPKKIRAMVGASEDDLKLLLIKRFLLGFGSGVVVIKHWKIHNYIQSDRMKPTTYIEEKETLTLDGKKAYTEKVDTDWIQNGYKMDTQVSIDKDRLELEKNSKEENAVGALSPQKRFQKPTLEEISSYCSERKNNINAQQFYNFYESKGWKVGSQPMKDWKACIRTWEQRENRDSPKKGSSDPTKYSREDEE